MSTKSQAAAAAALFTFAMTASAAETKNMLYRSGGAELVGYLALPEDLENGEKRPGVLVIHDWTGLQDYAKRRTEQLAELGYVAFAADVYGKGVRPKDPKQCGVQAGLYRSDRTLFRRRLNSALEQLKKQPACDGTRIAAVGYCFGGTGVIELARSGADVKGVVSFHGGLDSPRPEDGLKIKSKVLVCHGADDPFVSKENLDAFLAEMKAAKVDLQFVSYAGAVHSFTKPEAGDDPSKGAAYQKAADQRSWAHMRLFFGELFGE